MAPVEDFFRELDSLWIEPPPRIVLRIIGSGALMLQSGYVRGTKDSDVLETQDLTKLLQDRLLGIAGKETPLHHRRRIYLDIVDNGIPFLPRLPLWHAVEELRDLRHFDLRVLDITDVVVSKLKRFSANDIADISAMIDLDLVAHDQLIERFRSAFGEFSLDARASRLDAYVANLHRVERDYFAAGETDFSAELDARHY